MTWMPGSSAVGGRTERDEERRVVLDGRVGVGHAGRLGAVVATARRRRRGRARRRPTGRSPSTSPGASASMRNSLRKGSPWVRKPEPMISTPSSRSGRSRSPSLIRRCGSCGGQRHLQDRDVGLGEHDLQRHPGAVVEAAADVLVDGLAVGHHRRDPLGQVRGVRCLVGHLVVLRREPAEVVDERRVARREADRRGLPVGADDEDRRRARQVAGPGRQLPRPDRVVEQRAGRRGRCRGRACGHSCPEDS